MGKKLYVGNLSYETGEVSLRDAFKEFGEVVSVNIITDRYSGMSRGFGFVEMGTEEAARAAMSALNGKELDGRPLRVNEARERRNDNRRRS